MLTLIIHDQEHFDEEKNLFVEGPNKVVLELEHSLFTLAQWESKWKKPFLDSQKTEEETRDYVKIMTQTPDVSSATFARLNQDHFDQIREYIQAEQTATWFSEVGNGRGSSKKETITAEIIYYWLVALNIDWQTQYWHLSRLLTLVRVTNEKNTPDKHKKKMSRADAAAQRRAMNQQRRAKLGSRG